MKRIVGASLFGVGIGIGAIARESAHGFLPWAVVLGGHALLASALGLVMMFSGPSVRFGTALDWRVRSIGIALAVVMTVAWRALLGAAHSAPLPPLGWLVTAGATGLLLVPALFCWGYVFATFLPWRLRHPATVPVEHRPFAV